jgi:MoxR-like ATPase
MLRIDLSYPAREHELQVLQRYGAVALGSAPAAGAASGAAASVVVTAELLAAARACADAVHVAPELAGYVLDIAKATREHTQLNLGLSTRGALALLRAARVAAGLRGGEFVTPDDVKLAVPLVMPHRLMLASEALLEGTTELAVTQSLLDQVPVPR